jgi:glycosyltransferase involved in cell wall biosynthesis
MSGPCVSATSPNFNNARLLPRVIWSYLNQLLLPSEIIVVDDASTDNSREVLDELAQRRPLIRAVRDRRNLGCNASLNRGLELARSDYVISAAADDEVRPEIIGHLTRMLRDHPQAGLSRGISEWRCTTTGMSWYMGRCMPNKVCYLSPANMVDLSKSGRLAISNQNALYKKSASLEAGGWITELHLFADWFGACAVGSCYCMCRAPEVLSNFYLQPDFYCNANVRDYAGRRATLARILESFDSHGFDDVAPLVRERGLMGTFGWYTARVILAHLGHWMLLTLAFMRLPDKRCAELFGRRLFTNWLARWI